MAIVSYIAGIFQTPEIFLSLIACVGLLLQKKSASDVIKGTFKCMLGVIILNAGVAMLMSAVSPLSTAFGSLTSRQGAELADFGAFLGQYGMQMGLVMVIGFAVQLLLARFTPLKTIYLTGHMMMFFSMLWLGLGVQMGFTGGALLAFACFGYLCSISITPVMLLKDMEHLTGKRDFSIAHSGTFWCWCASRVGQLAAKTYGDKPIESMEKIKLSPKLDFIRDTTLVGGLIMSILYMVIAIFAPEETRRAIYGNDTFTFALTNGMSFGAGIIILLQGCRMMMAEIIPAFTGISRKLVPGAIPALDIPMIYPYGQNSLLIGYLFALAASIISMFIINFSGLSAYVLVPLVAAVYFDVASGCVFANSYGGRRGVIAWGIIGGVLIMVVTAVAMPLVANTVGTFVQQMGFSECSLWIIIIGYLSKLIGLA
jgi:PTS system ascorbate-specific IIC component